MIKAKKSLGQNFLIDQNIIDKIIDIVEIKDKSVLEIGPGTGNLTKNILKKKPKRLLVVEKDNDLVKFLSKNFDNQIKIINDDILKIDENNLDTNILTVFGNLPYNISTEILCKWILNIKDKHFWFDQLVLMFQKEVADRIIAKFNTKNYGRLSILSNWKLEIEKICDIKPSSFYPKPKIDSSVLLLKPKLNFFPLNDPINNPFPYVETKRRLFSILSPRNSISVTLTSNIPLFTCSHSGSSSLKFKDFQIPSSVPIITSPC